MSHRVYDVDDNTHAILDHLEYMDERAEQRAIARIAATFIVASDHAPIGAETVAAAVKTARLLLDTVRA